MMDDLARSVLNAARTRGWRIATAESCTGGAVCAALTRIAGASDVIEAGLITYSNTAKMRMLGVQKDVLDQFGAVSQQVAAQMAAGAAKSADVELAVAITGIAGPGGSDFKPEGRVCFGMYAPTGHHTETVEFGALGRNAVQTAATQHALTLLLNAAQSS